MKASQQNCLSKTPRGIRYEPVFEPNMDRMVKALKLVVDSPQKEKQLKLAQ